MRILCTHRCTYSVKNLHQFFCGSVKLAERYEASVIVHSLHGCSSIIVASLIPGANPGQSSEMLNLSGWHGIGHVHYCDTPSTLNSVEIQNPPVCVGCQERLSVEHILIHCVEYMYIDIRHLYFNVNTVRELFDTVPSVLIISFIRRAGLLYLIWNTKSSHSFSSIHSSLFYLKTTPGF